MIRIPFNLASDGTAYVLAPCRGVVVGVKVIWQTDAVEPGDTIIASQDTTPVCTVTAVTTAGLVPETGVRDVTNQNLIFDPAVSGKGVIKLVANGAAGISSGYIEFDQYAIVKETPLEATV
jgi:hypothetical protein